MITGGPHRRFIHDPEEGLSEASQLCPRDLASDEILLKRFFGAFLFNQVISLTIPLLRWMK